MANQSQDEVGYGKPPKESRFQKGKSGNPRGRPKKDPSVTALFRRVARQMVRINGKNGEQSMTKLEAGITQLVNKAATGDLKALKVMMQAATRFPQLVTDPDTAPVLTIELVEPKGLKD